jgi:hypothetical protein
MSPQLRDYADAYRQSQSKVHDVTDDLSDDLFNWKPDEESWSVGECVAHLNIVAEAYLPKLEAAVRSGGPRNDGPFTYGFVARKMIEGMRPGASSLSTSRSLNPSEGGTRSNIDKDQALRVFDNYTERYVAVCNTAEGLDLAKIKIRYPFFWLLRLPLGATLEITGLHARRHARQALQVSEHPDFPLRAA